MRGAANVSAIQRAYKENELVNAAITETVRGLISVPLLAEQWVPSSERWAVQPWTHPLVRLLEKPNPFIDRVRLLDRFWTDVATLGNGLLWKQRNNGGDVIALWPIDATTVVVKTDPVTMIEGYYVFKDGSTFGTGSAIAGAQKLVEGADPKRFVRYDPRDVIHLALSPDPVFPLWGLSPIAPTLASVDADDAITAFIIRFFQRGAIPAFLYEAEREMTEDEIARLKTQFESQQGGVDRSWGLAVVDRTQGKLTRMGLATGSREIGLHELRMDIEARILGPLNVPPIVVGAVIGLTHATYSNYGQARSAQHEENTAPNLVRIVSVFTWGLASEFGDDLRIQADTSQVMALDELQTSRTKRATSKLLSGGSSINEFRQEVGLPPTEGGDILLVPLNAEQLPVQVRSGAARPLPMGHNRIQQLAESLAKGTSGHGVIDNQVMASIRYAFQCLPLSDSKPEAHDWAALRADVKAALLSIPTRVEGATPSQDARRLLIATHIHTVRGVAHKLGMRPQDMFTEYGQLP
jgi:phage portal protein BeeE